ncbi:MAG: PAS domain-containing protein, partial [Caulobacteraceae bacterium]
MDYLKVGSGIAEAGGGVIAADENLCTILRRPWKQVIGSRMEMMTHPDDRAANRWLLDQAVITSVPFTLRKRYIFADSPDQWVENRYTILKRDKPHPLIVFTSRRADGPLVEASTAKPGESYNREYVANLASGLAEMSRAAGDTLVRELFLSAALVIAEPEAD